MIRRSYNRERVGEQIDVVLPNKRSELRTITDVILNSDSRPVILWSSKNGEGACVPTLWDEWAKGQQSYT